MGDLKRNTGTYAALLGGKKPASESEVDRFMMSCYQAVWHQPKLLDANRDSLLLAFAEAATVRLSLNPTAREAFIETRNAKVGDVYILQARFGTQYQGLIKLMHRGSDIDYIHADVVRRGDLFKVVGGSNPHIEHIQADVDMDPEVAVAYDSDDAILASYAVVKIRGATRDSYEVARRASILKARAMSKSNAWTNWFERMARKIPLRRLANIIPGADEARGVITLEDARERGEMMTLERVAQLLGDRGVDVPAIARGLGFDPTAPQRPDEMQALIDSSPALGGDQTSE